MKFINVDIRSGELPPRQVVWRIDLLYFSCCPIKINTLLSFNVVESSQIAISFDNGVSWVESNLPLEKISTYFYHYGGISQERLVVCDNVLIALKQ